MKPEKMTDGEIVELSDTDLDVMSTLRYGREVEAAVNAKWEAMLATQQTITRGISITKNGKQIEPEDFYAAAQPAAQQEPAMTFEQWLTENQKYIEPMDMHAWLSEAFEAGRRSSPAPQRKEQG